MDLIKGIAGVGTGVSLSATGCRLPVDLTITGVTPFFVGIIDKVATRFFQQKSTIRLLFL